MNDENVHLVYAVLARVGGLTMTAPIYGTSDVPLRVRVVAGGGAGLSHRALAMGRGDPCPGQCDPIWCCWAAKP